MEHDLRTQAAIDTGHPEWAELPESKHPSATLYFTGEPCQRGHVSPRQRSDGYCKACKRLTDRARSKRPDVKEKARKYGLQYDRRGYVKAQQRAYEQQPYVKKRLREYGRRWHQENKERRLAQIAEWERNNPERVRATSAARRAAEINATPAWADKGAILAVYAEAKRLTVSTGVPHEVDHIVPLMHPLVCGLHVAKNLRAIPASKNRQKGNKFDG